MAKNIQNYVFQLRTEENGQYGVFAKTVEAKDRAAAFKILIKELAVAELLPFIVTIDCQGAK